MRKKPCLLNRMFFLLIALLVVSSSPAMAQDRNQDHEQLRALLRSATEAMNSRNIDALAPLFYDRFSITTVDQRIFTNLADFKAYYEGMMTGPNAPLKSVTIKPEADALTEFIGDNIGLSYGTSTDTYHFSDGDTREMTSRWTATLYKDNGKWKIINVHIGTNLLDNPVVTSVKSMIYKVGAGALAAGLLIGFVIARLMRKKTGAA